MTYGQLATRARRDSPALCAETWVSSPATVSPSPRRTAPDYLDVLYADLARGHAPRCRPTPSSTAPSSATSSNSPARGVCFASAGLDAEIAPHAPSSLERLIVIGSAEYEKLFVPIRSPS